MIIIQRGRVLLPRSTIQIDDQATTLHIMYFRISLRLWSKPSSHALQCKLMPCTISTTYKLGMPLPCCRFSFIPFNTLKRTAMNHYYSITMLHGSMAFFSILFSNSNRIQIYMYGKRIWFKKKGKSRQRLDITYIRTLHFRISYQLLAFYLRYFYYLENTKLDKNKMNFNT